MLVHMFSYLRNQPSKQTKLAYLQFLLNYALFSKNCCRKLSKKEPRIWKYIIYFHWAISWLDIQRISKSNSIIFKKDQVFDISYCLRFIYVSSEITNFQKDLFFKEHSWSRRFSILFSISSITVFMISYFHIWNKIHVFDNIFGKMFFK